MNDSMNFEKVQPTNTTPETEESLMVDSEGHKRTTRTLLDGTVGSYSDNEELEYNRAIQEEQQ